MRERERAVHRPDDTNHESATNAETAKERERRMARRRRIGSAKEKRGAKETKVMCMDRLMALSPTSPLPPKRCKKKLTICPRQSKSVQGTGRLAHSRLTLSERTSPSSPKLLALFLPPPPAHLPLSNSASIQPRRHHHHHGGTDHVRQECFPSLCARGGRRVCRAAPE